MYAAVQWFYSQLYCFFGLLICHSNNFGERNLHSLSYVELCKKLLFHGCKICVGNVVFLPINLLAVRNRHTVFMRNFVYLQQFEVAG